jgi:hypothetical protein
LSEAEALGVVIDAEAEHRSATNELNRNIPRQERGNDVRPCIDPEDGDPGRNDFEQVGRSAGDEEKRESNEKKDPVAADGAAGSSSQIKKRNADGYVTQKGDGVGDGHCPDQFWIRRLHAAWGIRDECMSVTCQSCEKRYLK